MRPWLPVLALLALGCSVTPIGVLQPPPDATTAQDGPPLCIPGAQVACTCVGGATGAQVCDPAGRTLGPCSCPVADAGGIDVAPADATDAASPTDTADTADAADVVSADVVSADVADVAASVVQDGALDADDVADTGCSADLANDPMNCGECGRRCQFFNAAARCVAGVCTIGACFNNGVVSYANCDGDPANGCETDPRTSVTNCGGCGRRCEFLVTDPRGVSLFCSNGACGPSPCRSTTANCDGNPSNGCEVDTLTDSANCGGCGVRCPSGTRCINRRCSG